ncbi:glutamate-cysteine ligase family protein [Halomarina pelagica]|uniref:glutamate-cysteine ligase family protein n=1 Tax=Halomarina pelagica TaxID=2961599 RepID=UPI0020C51BF9|nr:glutamate-cysteine ligase family protein [Halomarina sp. BND7]
MKVGVEVEYWVIDEAGALSDGRALADGHEYVEPEFVAPLIEIQTPPVESEAALREALHSILRGLLESATAQSKHLVPLGTPLTRHVTPATSERGRLLERIYGSRLDPAKQCAGTHIHFDIGKPTPQLNLLTGLDPALALVSSSPCYDGIRAMSSSRAYAYRRRCGDSFTQFRDLWEYTPTVVDWQARLSRSYKDFHALAAERGVSDREFQLHFQPENTVMTPVRFRSHPATIEWRAPDTALPSQIVALTGDMVRLVDQTASKRVEIGAPGIYSDCIRIPEFEILTRLTTTAIRDGLGSHAVTDYLEMMGFVPADYTPISTEINCPFQISEQEARQIRLEYAERLARDVEILATGVTRSQPLRPSD